MLKLNVDSLDAVEEPLRALYVEKDGKFTLAVDGIEDTTGLKTALQTERKTAAELKKQSAAWKSLGKTPDEIQELIEAQEAKALSEAERKGEWDKLKNQMNEAHSLQLKSKDETIGAMRRRLEAELVDAKATAAIAAAKGVPELLLPIVQKFMKVDDDFNVQIVNAKGDPRVNDKGDPLSISDLITEMKSTELYGRAFEGSGVSGSGMRPASGNGGPVGRITKAELADRSKRIAWINANGGPEEGSKAYLALPDK